MPPGDIPSGSSNPADQDFNATLGLSGNVFADGQGTLFGIPFKFVAPLNHPLGPLSGSVKVNSSPQTDPLGTKFHFSLRNLFDIDNLDLLNGQTTGFAISPIILTSDYAIVTGLLAQGIKDQRHSHGTSASTRPVCLLLLVAVVRALSRCPATWRP